jgi:lysophospholipase L1-like esterase
MTGQKSRGFGWFLLLLLAAEACLKPCRSAQDAYARWEGEISAFAAADRTNPPPTNPIVFVGSSSIRIWKDLGSDFAGLPVLNRGFGGSQMDDSVHFAERLVLRYHPRQVFVYAGDNDLAAGKAPAQVFSDFQAFVHKVESASPETRIAYISIKPSPSRWKLAEQMQAANHLIADWVRSDQRLEFIDVFTPMLGSDGKPRIELFLSDQLHMNRKGYDLWADLIRPHLVR